MIVLYVPVCSTFVPLIDGGKDMPKLYNGWFNDQIAKQASSAVSRAIAAGKVSSFLWENYESEGATVLNTTRIEKFGVMSIGTHHFLFDRRLKSKSTFLQSLIWMKSSSELH